ncbi:alpha/beta hydrolase [Microbacterium sp. zg.Y1090]|uniref:alpha/beta fold hydrolase n=1 Tax=Microbacterium TaxID=33882 RepID=UPI00214B7C7E|nr:MULTISPECIES: alpha/beta hydrolase [unclassified Microbacterium]MCR2812971.1 alpha/beta hydrolase [Microbacterium sp. zg.Y1084]MCR2817219.1 alpha/beta hydrolase [Microbacterium sp. zg.Y1090]MDL5486112.1 alpha/beta hydrolase [Microbacterium sp. zg-Y1211]WIM29290.1 alpha/beta hydrolase [Microbacterium sp. zg-Y1090]
MPAPVALPRYAWGDPASPRHALLIHGLGSNGPLMWRFGTALADAGWHATAVDLRGHGAAPRALDCTIAAYAADVAATTPATDDAPPAAWDLVIGHSLGGAAATVAAAATPGWTRRLVLIDPGIYLAEGDRAIVRDSQERSFADPTEAAVRAEHPDWHPLDIELKALSVRQASRWTVEQTSEQNAVWDVRADAARLQVPTHVIASDPAVYSIFTGEVVDDVVANPHVTMSVVAGAGHSPHRDRPDETLRLLWEALR